MNAQIKRKICIIFLILLTIIGIQIIIKIPKGKEMKKQVDISVMEGEKAKKVISLNRYITTDSNPENAYILGDKGKLYVLCCDSENYYAALWHPEFWEGINVVDLCAGDKKNSYVLALDDRGNVYIWEKEYQLKESEWEKKDDWNIQRMENIPKMAEIFSGYSQFVLVTKEGEVYRFNLTGNSNLELETIDVESPVLGMGSLDEELFIIDCNHVLWCIENGTKKIVKENVKAIMQGEKGFVIQLMDDENTVYVYNIHLLQDGYEMVTFAGKYEVAKVKFEREISLLAVSSQSAVVCVDEERFFRWGRTQRRYSIGKLGYSASLSDKVYEKPIEVDMKGAWYCMLIGKDIVYIDEQNRMFVLVQNF